MRTTDSSVSRRRPVGCALGLSVLLLAPAAARAQEPAGPATPPDAAQAPASMAALVPDLDDDGAGAVAGQAQQPAQPATDPINPFADRPVCASLFMKTDWQLTGKQKTCEWIHNGVFSTNAMLGAAWSAGFSQRTNQASERGDGFTTRFGRKFAQNAFKSTGSFLGGQIFREDPRKIPPHLARQRSPRPTGFFKRAGHALGGNFISYRCAGDCSTREDIRKVPALSRVVGSLASGFAGELLTHDRPDSTRHALRGAASAYGSTFLNALFVEFKSELSAFAGTAFTKIFGAR